MTQTEDSPIPQDWIRVAKKDWQRIQVLLNIDDLEAAAFFLQQALEKFLKAFLLKNGWKLKKIHALHDLLSDAVKYLPSLESFRYLCERASGYYMVDRYPLFFQSGITMEDMKADQKEAGKLIKTLFPEEELKG